MNNSDLSIGLSVKNIYFFIRLQISHIRDQVLRLLHKEYYGLLFAFIIFVKFLHLSFLSKLRLYI